MNNNSQKLKLINNFASITPSDDFCEVIKEGVTESTEEKKLKEARKIAIKEVAEVRPDSPNFMKPNEYFDIEQSSDYRETGEFSKK